MYNITEPDREFKTLLKDNIEQFEKDFEKNFFTQEATLEMISNAVDISNEGKFLKNRIIWNVACYINIVSYDLKIIAKRIAFAEREWEKRYFARQAGLLIYEAINDLFDLFGKEFRATISVLSNIDMLNKMQNAITKDLNEYKAEYFDRLNEIRNVSIAHRDKDTLLQLKTIQSISWLEAINYISAFDKILNSAGAFMQEVMSKSVRELDGLK